MKKLLTVLILGTILTIGTSSAKAEDATPKKEKPKCEQSQKMKQNFEKRLNLTEKQKEKAKKIHQKGFKQMEPIMKQMGAIRKDIATVKKSDMEESVKKEKLQKDFEELKALDKKARDIRKANSKEFEKILTKEQKAELEKMKAEGRKKFEREHHPRPPFGFDLKPSKPLFPPPDRPLPVPVVPVDK